MFGGVFSWSNVLYERVYPGGDLLIQFVGRDAYKQFWNFSKDEKENLATQLAIELPALRGKVGASQEEIASAVGISRQTYSAYENRTRPIPWSLYLALLFYFDYIPSTHVKAKLFCPEIAGLFCRIAGLFCHDSRANLSLKPVCFGIAIS